MYIFKYEDYLVTDRSIKRMSFQEKKSYDQYEKLMIIGVNTKFSPCKYYFISVKYSVSSRVWINFVISFARDLKRLI